MNKMEQSKTLQELSIEEQESVAGGLGPLALLAIGTAVGVIVEQWSDIKQGVSDAWNGK